MKLANSKLNLMKIEKKLCYSKNIFSTHYVVWKHKKKKTSESPIKITLQNNDCTMKQCGYRLLRENRSWTDNTSSGCCKMIRKKKKIIDFLIFLRRC